MEIKEDLTERGFAFIEFQDRYGQRCLVLKSSLATEDALWIGAAKAPDTRMHLTQAQVAALLPYLVRFVETGELLGPTP